MCRVGSKGYISVTRSGTRVPRSERGRGDEPVRQRRPKRRCNVHRRFFFEFCPVIAYKCSDLVWGGTRCSRRQAPCEDAIERDML